MKKTLIAALLLSGFSPAYSQTFNGGSGAIHDYQTTEIPINVSGLGSSIDTIGFGLEQVCINLTHTWDSDLTISIVAPDGTSAMLAAAVGGDGDHFTNTCFDWNAATAIASGSAPFTGTFKPSGQMGLVNNGQNPNGTWKITVYDSYSGDEGNVISCAITFGSDPATYFAFSESDLPIVVINTNGQNISDDPKIMADMGIIYNGVGQRNHLSDPHNAYNGKAGIEIRGNYSASLPQKPYGFETWDANGNAVNVSLLGMPEESDWVLLANYNDKSFARNIVPFHIFEQMGHYAVRTRLVDVVLNDEYKGIYLLGEKIKRDTLRVSVPKLEPTEITGVDVTGGYILKIDYWDGSNSWQLDHSPVGYPGLDVHMVYYYPKADEIVPQQQSYIQSFIGLFEDALYGPEFDDPVNGYRQYLSTPTFIDYMLVSEVTRNVDGYKKSHFFYKDKDHNDGTFRKLKSGPVWDFDWALKDIDWGSDDGSGLMYLYPDQDVNATGWEIRLMQDTVFANEVRCRYDDLRRNILSEAYLFAKIDSVANVVNESQAWHYAVWGHLGQATGTPEVQAPSQTYAEEVQRLKDWLHRRFEWLDANLPGTLNGCSMAGMNDLSESSTLTAYPNPFTGTISIEWPSGDLTGCNLRLLDETGRVHRSLPVTSDLLFDGTLSVSGLDELAKGVYLVELTKGEQRRVLKVLK